MDILVNNAGFLVSGIAEETAAGVQEVNAASNVQDAAIKRIAERAVEVNALAQQLFTEIKRFRVE